VVPRGDVGRRVSGLLRQVTSAEGAAEAEADHALT
jgi:hypothetical protein